MGGRDPLVSASNQQGYRHVPQHGPGVCGCCRLSSDSHDSAANVLLPKSSFQSLFLNLLFNYKDIFNFPGAGNQQCSSIQSPQPVQCAAIHQSCVCTSMHLTWCVGRNPLLSSDI